MAEIIDALRRDGDSSNSVIGIVILVLLSVFVAPDVLPQLVADTIPWVEEGLPCNSLLSASDRTNHQSLIGRAASDPLSLAIEIGRAPTNGTDTIAIRVIVINTTIGTVPFVFNPNQVLATDVSNTSGLGLIFAPPYSGTLDFDENGVANTRAPQGGFPNEDIKILGPRQRCVHVVRIPHNQIAGRSVRPYYRITTSGAFPSTNPLATPVFPNQGLQVVSGGLVEGRSVTIPFAATANDVPQ